MMLFSAFVLLLSLRLVAPFAGVVCGDYKCVEDPNVRCNTDTNTCECMPGYVGNARLKCVDDTHHFCSMLGDPHITTFNKESSFIYLPCTQILTKLEVPRPGEKNLAMQVTALTTEAYQAMFPSQIVITGLIVDLSTLENNEIIMRCDTNGCWDRENNFAQVVEHSNKNLNFTVWRDAKNGQTVVTIPSYQVEVRFRAEDGSVTIEVPPDTIMDDQFPGLCNKKIPDDAPNANAVAAGILSLSYNDYIFYSNVGNIDVDQEKDPRCQSIYNSVCSPKSAQAIAVRECAGTYTNKKLGECYYLGNNKTSTLDEFLGCHSQVCVNAQPTAYCEAIDTAGCDAGLKPQQCP